MAWGNPLLHESAVDDTQCLAPIHVPYPICIPSACAVDNTAAPVRNPLLLSTEYTRQRLHHCAALDNVRLLVRDQALKYVVNLPACLPHPLLNA